MSGGERMRGCLKTAKLFGLYNSRMEFLFVAIIKIKNLRFEEVK